MTSEAQRDANRANAQLSTGPKSDSGKASSARNARKLGMLSRNCLMDHESKGEFLTFAIRFRYELAPMGELEELLVDRITSCAWRLRRVICRVADVGVQREI